MITSGQPQTASQPIQDELAETVRNVWSRFASGVTVITVADTSGPWGLTASAVASISMLPPLALVSVAHSSDTHDHIRKQGLFAINVLSSEQSDLSRLFASDSPAKFKGVAHRPGASGSPLLDGALAHLECEVVDTLNWADHSLFVGRIISAAYDPSTEPLIYFRRRYHSLAADPPGP